MAARTKRIAHDEKTRLKIKTSQLLNRLTDHVLGSVELSPTQVRAAEILLKKTLPDLSAVELSGEVAHKQKHEFTDAELAAIAAGGSPGAAEAEAGAESADSVH